MKGNLELLLPVVLPILAGTVVVAMKKLDKSVLLRVITAATLLVSSGLVVYNSLAGGLSLQIWELTDRIPIMFKLDDTGRFFSVLTAVMWTLTAFFAFAYMRHEEREHQFFGFYLIAFGILVGLDYAGNLMTLYMFYELMTMLTVPFVIHSRTKEAIAAGYKYLLYSLLGAFMGLLGIFFVHQYGTTLEFLPGGVFTPETLKQSGAILLVIAMVGIFGFSTKAGMFPLHGWLPTAHPVAPAPASAVLSGIITKSGVLGLIRLVYYIFGDDFLRGSWVQYTWIALALGTVLMGSAMAFREKTFKKRLAYSTVSQVSYILFGLAVLTPTAFTGALMHVVFHASIKITLFLSAGAIIYKTGLTQVDDYRGIGQKMPATMTMYSIAALGLIGIPPLSGFMSKWFLASGALEANLGFLSWFGPVILLVSALLTAGYLLPIITEGFFPGKNIKKLQRDEVGKTMLVPMGILAALVVYFGIFPSGLIQFIQRISAAVL